MAEESKTARVDLSQLAWIPDVDLDGSLMKEVEITIRGESEKRLAYIGNGEHPNVYTKDGNIIGKLNYEGSGIYLAYDFSRK